MFHKLLLTLLAGLAAVVSAHSNEQLNRSVDAALAQHAGLSGSYVLNEGEEALLARAWMVDNATTSIEVQYFIWSTDNIGVLAAEALLRAAERGVKVRVIVDDLLIDAPDEGLMALARHPNINIRIYNPVHSVGVPWYKRALSVATDFRGANQRMHDKTLIVDGRYAITGGRNMADEYFDFDHAYNFRDRDALVVGPVVRDIRASFERFWASPLAVSVESLYGPLKWMQKHVTVDAPKIQQIYRQMHAYARDPANFAPEVRAAIGSIGTAIPAVINDLAWSQIDFVSDVPGKNNGQQGMDGGGLSSVRLAALLQQARSEVLIQSPYLVLSDEALTLLRALRQRGVKVRISTNSLASTDNLQAFSGYRNQREEMLKMGLEIAEYRPYPAIAKTLMQRYAQLRKENPVFALHAKTMVVDRTTLFIGTYNLDPRSQNLNTEVGVIIRDDGQARRVADTIILDMHPSNSWDAARDDPDRYASAAKRAKVRAWQKAPLKPLL